MFSGIVDGYSTVSSLQRKEFFQTFSVSLSDDLRAGLAIGASVSIDGVCMTVTRIDKDNVYFDAMEETLDRTTLGELQEGTKVNIERSVKYGDEIGGHNVSGHVHGKAKIIKIDTTHKNNCVMHFSVSRSLMKYLFTKGFISLNGASLTLVNVDKMNNKISVSLIPETLKITTFGLKKVGEYVNIEIDSQTQSIVDTVERYLNDHGAWATPKK